MKFYLTALAFALTATTSALACSGDEDCDRTPAPPVVILSVGDTLKEIKRTVARDVCSAQDIKVAFDAVHTARSGLDALLLRASEEERKAIVVLRDQLLLDSDAIIAALFDEVVTTTAKDMPKPTSVIRSNLCVKYIDSLF